MKGNNFANKLKIKFKILIANPRSGNKNGKHKKNSSSYIGRNQKKLLSAVIVIK